MPTRRQFLLNCSTVAVTASVTPATVFGAPFHFQEVSLEHVSFSAFAAHLNAVFHVQSASGSTVRLQLVEVQPTPSFPAAAAAADAANEKFSLLFRAPLKQPLEQGSYWFEHQGIGRFAIFIVPIGSTETSHCYYEAIFNRPVGGPLPKAGVGNIPRGRARNPGRRSQQT
jgi:uncharacterized protein DUF6916